MTSGLGAPCCAPIMPRTTKTESRASRRFKCTLLVIILGKWMVEVTAEVWLKGYETGGTMALIKITGQVPCQVLGCLSYLPR